MTALKAEVSVIGTGIVGIATAYYLARDHGITDIVLIDQGQPMAFTSAQSGENYRNWWPHPLMVAFTNRSIDLMEDIARASGNRIAMNRRGYILCTRKDDINPMVDQLSYSLGDAAEGQIRIHEGSTSGYRQPASADWQAAPDGFDILKGSALIQSCFSSLDTSVQAILHIRRGGGRPGSSGR